MKKNYVNLELQVVNVQLSDCIAGSIPTKGFKTKEGSSQITEVNNAFGGNSARFTAW